MKRIMLFLATNLAIIIVLSITLRLLGVERILDEQGVGLDINSLLIFAAVFGFGGSFISLAISKWTAKRMTGAKVIEQPANNTEQWLAAPGTCRCNTYIRRWRINFRFLNNCAPSLDCSLPKWPLWVTTGWTWPC